MNVKHALLTVLAVTLPLAGASAQPAVPGAATSTYATVTDPYAISFGADGALYVGRDNYGTGGPNEEPFKIRRVGPGGSPLAEFGNAAIPDPDAVIVDRAGLVSGIADAVLVGGMTGPDTGQISRVAPDGTVTVLFGPSSLYINPNGFAFDALGRLLFTEWAQGRVYRSDGGTPTLLLTLSGAFSIATDAADRIVVSPAVNPGSLWLYSSDGTLSNASFAAVRPATPLARGPGGFWTTDLYAITASSNLIRIALDGTTTTMGSGFGDIEGLTFGPDGALYASDFSGDRVWRIAPLPQQWTTNTLPPGLIAWWQAEGNMLDSAGTHHGSGSASPTYGVGRFGQALQFNGTDQSVSVPDVHADLDSWTQFTLEAWVNLDNTLDGEGGGQSFFSKVGDGRQPGPDLGYSFGFAQSASKLYCQFNTNGQAWPGFQTAVDLGSAAPTNVWLHVAATYDHNAVKLYLNGTPLVTNVIGAATIVDCASSLRLNGDDNANVFFAGRMDDARIYNRALSAAEIAYLYAGLDLPVTQGLKLHLDASDVNAGSNPADGASVTTWRDLSGLGLDATPLFGVAPVYRTGALNGRAGVDFGLSGSDALATAITNQLNFTNCTIFMVGNAANSGTHVSISAASVMQEYGIYDKGIQHHSSPFHYVYRNHQVAPAGFYVQAAVFGTKPGQLDSFINGVASTNGFVFGQQSPTLNDVADYTSVNRQAILGWRNSDANGNPPVANENFAGVICEVLVYDRELSTAELDTMNFYLSGKYGLAVTPIPPTLRVARITPDQIAFAWDATPGRAYQVHTATSLSPANWTNLGSSFVPSASPVAVTNAIGTDPARFFRVQTIGN